MAVNAVELSVAAAPVSSSPRSTTSSPVSRQSRWNDDGLCQWMIYSRSATCVPVAVTRSYLVEVTPGASDGVASLGRRGVTDLDAKAVVVGTAAGRDGCGPCPGGRLPGWPDRHRLTVVSGPRPDPRGQVALGGDACASGRRPPNRAEAGAECTHQADPDERDQDRPQDVAGVVNADVHA